jgi:polysaccharide export outer membrane protein
MKVLALIFQRGWPQYVLLVCLATLPAACQAPLPNLVGVRPRGTGHYIIGPGDDLNVFVYRAPELSAIVPVRPDGHISTPLAPDVLAAGRTSTQLAEALEARLRQYVKEPNVTVMVTGFVGPVDRQIRVIGQVAQPLELPYRDGMTVLDAMIAAKGLTPFAAGNRAVIVRQEPGGPQKFRVRLGDLLTDGDMSQNVALQPGDTVFVPEAWF